MNAAPMTSGIISSGTSTTGPAMAMIGEGRYQEAVLPLSRDTFQQIAAGIKNAGGRSGGGSGAGGGNTTTINVAVNYYGSGKWTRQDARDLGPLIVSELRAAGVRSAAGASLAHPDAYYTLNRIPGRP